MDLVTSPAWLRRWAVASLVANVVIVWTGGLVRNGGTSNAAGPTSTRSPRSTLPSPRASSWPMTLSGLPHSGSMLIRLPRPTVTWPVLVPEGPPPRMKAFELLSVGW